jgi:hypothetical protein
MLGKKKYLASELTEDLPVIFLLIEEDNSFSKDLAIFFQNCGFETKTLLLSSFANPDLAAAQLNKIKQAEVYKFLVIGGFKASFIDEPETLLRTLKLLEKSFVDGGRVLPIFFLLNYSNPLSPINFQLSNYELFWSREKLFINRVLKTFPLASLCLIEDYIDVKFDLNLKFSLFFALFEERLLLDNQDFCYWQDKQSFFAQFQKLFFQSKAGDKLILRGSKTSSSSFLTDAKSLCGRYFLDDFDLVKLFIEGDQDKTLLADFIKIYYSCDQVDKVLDQKIRQLPLSLHPELILSKNDLQALKEQEILKKPLTQIEPPETVSEPELPVIKIPEQEKKSEPAPNQSTQKKNNQQAERLIKEKKDKKNDKSTDIDKKLQNIFRSEQKKRQTQRFQKNLKGAKKIVKKSRYRRISFYFGIFLATAGLLLLLFFANFYVTQKLFEKNLTALMKESIDEKAFSHNLNQEKKQYEFFKWQLDFYQRLGAGEMLSSSNSYWDIFEQINLNKEIDKELSILGFNLIQEMQKTDGDLESMWSMYLSKKEAALLKKQELGRLLDQLNPEIMPDEKAKTLNEYKTQLLKKARVEQRTIAFLDALSEYLLSPARSNIVLLIQDSNELRSSGGFLTSLLTISFENSHLLNWQVYDVAELDQRIYGDRQANEELQSLLAADKLLLRDANWSVNFLDAGSEISWFIEQSINLKPDLIVSLNSKELHSLSTPLFPIRLADLELNQSNFFEMLLREESVNLSDYTREFFDQLLNATQDELLTVSQELTRALENRELFIYSASEELLAVIKNNLWSGELLETPCPNEFSNNNTCFTDGIFQLENNIGLNKVNRLITHKIDHSIGISENFIRHKRIVRLENLSRQNFWPEGDYQTYLKFYLPSTAKLEKFTIDERKIDRSAYRWFEDVNKQVLAYQFKVPVLSSRTLEVVYLIPHQLQPPFSYVFLDQKQAGIFDKATKYRVLFEENFQPNLIAPQANYANKIIEFENNNLDNFLFAVAF